MPANIIRSTTVYATTEPRYGANGKVYRQAVASAALTAGTAYSIIFNEFGPKAVGITDVADTIRIGVAEAAASAAAVVWLQTGGPCTMTTPTLSMSVGHALKVHDGAIADVGADYTGSTSEFAVATAVSTSATSQEVFLVDKEILTTT